MPADHALLRAATPDDAVGCAYVHHTSWVETYSGLVPDAHWDSDTLERRTRIWHERLAAGADVTVAVVGGEVVGFAIPGEGCAVGGHAPVRDRALYALYVLAAHHGTGVGQVLLDAVLAPGSPAEVWVAERNPRARRFYERNGFLADGARCDDEPPGIAVVRHVR